MLQSCGLIKFDPFCGSGSTCVAAQMKKRRWLGVELENKYVDLPRKRIEES